MIFRSIKQFDWSKYHLLYCLIDRNIIYSIVWLIEISFTLLFDWSKYHLLYWLSILSCFETIYFWCVCEDKICNLYRFIILIMRLKRSDACRYLVVRNIIYYIVWLIEISFTILFDWSKYHLLYCLIDRNIIYSRTYYPRTNPNALFTNCRNSI
jgi:hypothetical protein